MTDEAADQATASGHPQHPPTPDPPAPPGAAVQAPELNPWPDDGEHERPADREREQPADADVTTEAGLLEPPD